MNDAGTILRGIADSLSGVAPLLPGLGEEVARYAASALGLAADLAKAGKDPIQEIQRIRAIADVRREIDDRVADYLTDIYPE